MPSAAPTVLRNATTTYEIAIADGLSDDSYQDTYLEDLTEALDELAQTVGADLAARRRLATVSKVMPSVITNVTDFGALSYVLWGCVE